MRELAVGDVLQTPDGYIIVQKITKDEYHNIWYFLRQGNDIVADNINEALLKNDKFAFNIFDKIDEWLSVDLTNPSVKQQPSTEPDLDFSLLKEVTMKMLEVTADKEYLPNILRKSVLITQFLQTGHLISDDEFQSFVFDNCETAFKHS